MKHKLFTLLLAMIASIGTLFASDIQVNGIWYIFDSSTQTATVTYQGSSHVAYVNEYSGAVVIPESVSYGGRTYSVTSIGGYAFWECTGLTSVTIPNSVASIGNLAFSGCSGLTSVTIPNSVTSIGIWAFASCSGLTSVTIGNSVTSIGDDAFNHCSSLTSVTIGNSVTSIESGAFAYCSSLTSVTIPNSVTSIGQKAFYSCTGLTSVTIGNSVTRIGDYAFSGCTGLTSIEIPNSVTSIGSRAFEGCSSLTSVTNYATTPQTITTNVFDRVNISSCTLYVPAGSLAAYKKATIWKNFGTIQAIGGTPCSPISGTCGGNLTWTLSCDSVLSISGTGTMPDFNSTSDNPWYAHRNAIKFVIIGNSVTSIGNYAFRNYTGLTSVTIPNSVTSIGERAFYSCPGLTSVTIPNSVTSIGNYAFGNCSGLTSVTLNSNAIVGKNYSITSSLRSIFGSQVTEYTIGNTVAIIGNYAFFNCSGLTSVTIPNSVTSFGGGAFENCSGLTSVTIPNSVTNIGEEAFYGCSGLTSVTIPNSVTSIGRMAFYNCSGLTSVTINSDAIMKKNTSPGASFADIFGYQVKNYMIGNGVTSIGGDAFYGCSGLTSVTIPNSVTSIGRWAFYNCSGLTSVTIPNSITSIGDWAFGNCSGLTSVTNYATTPQTISSNVFSSVNISSCTLHVPAGSRANYQTATVWKDFGTIQAIGGDTPCAPISGTCGGNLTWELSCDSILTISGTGAMTDYSYDYSQQKPQTPWNSYLSVIKSVIMEDGVISIGNWAFGSCRNLTSVTIPNSVTSIGQDAFVGCTSLTSVTIPNSVISIGNSAFSGCRGLTSVTIPNSVTSIGMGAFDNCDGLTSVTIPNSVTSIGSSAFYGCSGLTSVTIGSGVTSIGDRAFYGCSGLTSVTIPNSVTSIGNSAFAYCKGLTSVTIGSGVTSIGSSAFRNCDGLTSVTIPNSVTSIGNNAFAYCKGLTSLNVNKDNLEYSSQEGVLFNKEKTILILYPMKKAASSYVIPSSVTSIEEMAFRSSSLTSVTIPNSVTSIGQHAFQYCRDLASVNNYATTPQTITTNVFDNVNISACTLHVLAESVEAYKAADVWKEFWEITTIGAEGIDVTTTTVTASATTADIVWPKVTGAVTYTLEIKKNGELICTLTFDAEGHLISMSFAAPSRHNAPHQTQAAGFSFTITGLESGTTYSYTMIVKGSDGNVLKTESGTFTTIGAEGIEDAQSDQVQSTKILRNGQIFIQRGEKIYTITGQKIQSY